MKTKNAKKDKSPRFMKKTEEWYGTKYKNYILIYKTVLSSSEFWGLKLY